MSPYKAENEAPVLTTWAFLATLIVIGFGAGSWATWMSFQVDFLKTQVAEIHSDIKDIKSINSSRALSKNP